VIRKPHLGWQDDAVGAETLDRRHGSQCVSSGVAESQTVCSIGCAHIALRPLGSEMLRGTSKALRLLLHGSQDRKGDALRLVMLRHTSSGGSPISQLCPHGRTQRCDLCVGSIRLLRRGEDLLNYLADLVPLGEQHIGPVVKNDGYRHRLVDDRKADVLSAYLCGDLSQGYHLVRL